MKRKELLIEDDTIKIIEYKTKFLSLKETKKEFDIPVHLLKLVQKAYVDGEGPLSVAIFLETDVEFLITHDEVENIDMIFENLLDLKNRTNNSFRAELYNIETKNTIDK